VRALRRIVMPNARSALDSVANPQAIRSARLPKTCRRRRPYFAPRPIDGMRNPPARNRMRISSVHGNPGRWNGYLIARRAVPPVILSSGLRRMADRCQAP
jgi:hypothetical protein